jgi:hypothetical protein
MSLKLSGYLFTGPFPIDSTSVRANQQPVVFAIIAKGGPGWAPTFRVIDVGFSEDSGVTFADHPARRQWDAASGGVASVYLFYAPKSEYSIDDRRKIASALHAAYDPPNGLVQN